MRENGDIFLFLLFRVRKRFRTREADLVLAVTAGAFTQPRMEYRPAITRVAGTAFAQSMMNRSTENRWKVPIPCESRRYILRALENYCTA